MAVSLNTKASLPASKGLCHLLLGAHPPLQTDEISSRQFGQIVQLLGQTPGSLLQPSKLHNVTLLKRLIIPFGIRKQIFDCLWLVGGAWAGVRVPG